MSYHFCLKIQSVPSLSFEACIHSSCSFTTPHWRWLAPSLLGVCVCSATHHGAAALWVAVQQAQSAQSFLIPQPVVRWVKHAVAAQHLRHTDKPCSGTAAAAAAAALKSHGARCPVHAVWVIFTCHSLCFLPLSCWDQVTFLQALYFRISVHGIQSIICQLTRRCWVYTTVTVFSLEGHFNESYSHWAAIVNERQEPSSFWRTCSFFMTYWFCCLNDHPVTKVIHFPDPHAANYSTSVRPCGLCEFIYTRRRRTKTVWSVTVQLMKQYHTLWIESLLHKPLACVVHSHCIFWVTYHGRTCPLPQEQAICVGPEPR